MKRPLHIALLGGDFLLSGGADFLRNLANALLSIQNGHRLRLFLLLPVRNKVDTFTDLQKIILKAAASAIRRRKLTLPKLAPVYDSTFLDCFKNVDGVIEPVQFNAEIGLIPALRRIEADVVMPAANSLGVSFPIPWVGYAFDFQHKYFPDYFSAFECLGRDIQFATMLRDAKAIIVNARSVKDDINRFFPYHKCEVFNLPFSASPVSSWLEVGNPDIQARYNLPSRYFLISNQFWIHKSHSTAFRALATLVNSQDSADLHLVCTGRMEDYRFPDYIQGLYREVSNLGIKGRVHFLGHIPKIDQIAIMKKSLAVLQPTLFEGGPGGGAVFDAVSLGIPAIISDIPVNREIENEKNVYYFKAGSERALAEEILKFLREQPHRPVQDELTARGEQRKRMLGERLLEAIHLVIGEPGNGLP